MVRIAQFPGKKLTKHEQFLKKKESLLDDIAITLEQREKAANEKEKILKNFESAKKSAEKRKTDDVIELAELELKISQRQKIAATLAKEISNSSKTLAIFTATLEAQKIQAEKDNAEKIKASKKEIAEQKAEFEAETAKKKQALDIETAQKKKELAAEMLKSKKELDAETAQKKEEIDQKKGELDIKISQFSKLQKEIFKKEAEISSTVKLADEKESEVLNKEAELDEKANELNKNEREFVHRELDIAIREDQLKETADALERQKDEFKEEFEIKKAAILQLIKEWDERKAEFNSIKQEIHNEEDRISKLINTDAAALAEKEDEIVKSVKEFENDRAKLAHEEKCMLIKVKQLERATATFKKEEKKLLEREKEVKRLEDYSGRAVEKIEAAKKKIDEQQKKLSAVKALQLNIAELQRRHEELRQEIHKEKQMLKAVGHVSAKEEKKRQREFVSAISEEQIEQKLAEAENLINGRNLAEASEMLNELEYIYSCLSGKRKNLLRAGLAELKTNLKLAKLE